jgi:nicotinamide-nucleotide amidase
VKPNSSPTVSILISGAEILDGRVLDTNSNFLLGQLAAHGIIASRTAICGDYIDAIGESLSFLATSSQVTIISGGMGPTGDDLTREAVSAWLGVPLVERADARDQIERFYAERGRTFDPANYKQILFPEGAEIIPNPRGSAPGFLVCRDGVHPHWIFALPGVPGELRAMTEESVLPLLRSRCFPGSVRDSPIPQAALRVFGLPESEVGARVGATRLPAPIEVSYRAAFPEVHVLLKDLSATLGESALREASEAAKAAIGPSFIISEDLSIGLEQVVLRLLEERRLTCALAESCTGGMIGQLLTSVPGSSKSFIGGVVTYHNDAKVKLLGVSPGTLAAEGAVSAATAREMALGAKRSLDASLAVSITGVAGPDGGTPEKPVGLFYVGYADEREVFAIKCFFSSTRERIRRFATFSALDLIRRMLLGLEDSRTRIASEKI